MRTSKLFLLTALLFAVPALGQSVYVKQGGTLIEASAGYVMLGGSLHSVVHTEPESGGSTVLYLDTFTGNDDDELEASGHVSDIGGVTYKDAPPSLTHSPATIWNNRIAQEATSGTTGDPVNTGGAQNVETYTKGLPVPSGDYYVSFEVYSNDPPTVAGTHLVGILFNYDDDVSTYYQLQVWQSFNNPSNNSLRLRERLEGINGPQTIVPIPAAAQGESMVVRAEYRVEAEGGTVTVFFDGDQVHSEAVGFDPGGEIQLYMYQPAATPDGLDMPFYLDNLEMGALD